jgi:hypothetical protein
MGPKAGVQEPEAFRKAVASEPGERRAWAPAFAGEQHVQPDRIPR